MAPLLWLPYLLLLVRLYNLYACVAFSWPVTWSKARIKVVHEGGWLFCTFPKAARCPLSSIDIAESALDLESLTPWPQTKVMDMQRMFLPQELRIIDTKFMLPHWPPYFSLRLLFGPIYKAHTNGRDAMLVLCDRELKAEIGILLKGMMAMDGWGRPVLEMVYADLRIEGKLLEDFAMGKYATGAMLQAMQELPDIMSQLVVEDGIKDIGMLRDLLKRNASLTKASTWQRTRQGGLIWKATFLTLLDPQGAEPLPGVPH